MLNWVLWQQKLRLPHTFTGGQTKSLHKRITYTRKAQPSTWTHLKVSQPRLSDTTQVKRVRHAARVSDGA